MEKGVQFRHAFLAPGGILTYPPPEFVDWIERHRQNNHGDDGQLPVAVENDENQAEDGKNVPQRRGDRLGHHVLDDIDVVGDPGHQHPGLVPMIKGQRQIGYLCVEFIAEFPDDSLAHEMHEVMLAVKRKGPQDVYAQNQRGHQPEHPLVLLHEDIV